MLVTFIIEALLAVYIYLKHKGGIFNHLAVIIIAFLAVFQLAEYSICAGTHTLFWMRIGLIAITFLPPLGIHMISIITKRRFYLGIGYFLMILFVIIFSFLPASIGKPICGGNYIIFDSHPTLMSLYGIYYSGFILLALYEGITYLRVQKNKVLTWILIGYLSFLIPMGLVYLALPQTRIAVPSIMCGFAIIFALILALIVVPENIKKKK